MTDGRRIDRFTLSSAAGLTIEKAAEVRAVAAPAGIMRAGDRVRLVAGGGRRSSVVGRAGAADRSSPKWHLIDADGLVVGRAAVVIANILRGKHKTSFAPHVDCGDNVVVINADKIRFAPDRAAKKVYYKHAGYAGGIKQVTAAKVLDGRFPERVLEKAVERMIPRGPLGRAQMRNLRIFKGAEHPQLGGELEKLDISALAGRKRPGG